MAKQNQQQHANGKAPKAKHQKEKTYIEKYHKRRIN